jgi:hypothetical protein
MRNHTLGNIPLPLTKTWNTFSPGRCGSYLPQVHPTGIRTTLCHTHSAVFECCIEPGRCWEKERQREERKEVKSRRRNSPYTTESAEIDHRQKLKKVGIDDEDKELMDEGTMSDI